MNNHEAGLVRQYRDAISRLSVAALKGEDVTEKVKAAVVQHCEHFRVLKSSKPIDNLVAYRAALKMASHSTYESQPEVKTTFDYALSVCPIEL